MLYAFTYDSKLQKKYKPVAMENYKIIYQELTKREVEVLECLVAGLPFYAHSLIATIVFLPAFMVAYNFITNKTNSLLLS